MKFIKRFMLNRPAEKRLAYFYSMVATDEQVWLLEDKHGDLLVSEGDEEFEFLVPVWPSRSFAEMEAANIKKPCKAFNLPLSQFLNDLLVDIEEDGGAAAIFPNQKDTTIQTREEIKEMFDQINE